MGGHSSPSSEGRVRRASTVASGLGAWTLRSYPRRVSSHDCTNGRHPADRVAEGGRGKGGVTVWMELPDATGRRTNFAWGVRPCFTVQGICSKARGQEGSRLGCHRPSTTGREADRGRRSRSGPCRSGRQWRGRRRRGPSPRTPATPSGAALSAPLWGGARTGGRAPHSSEARVLGEAGVVRGGSLCRLGASRQTEPRCGSKERSAAREAP